MTIPSAMSPLTESGVLAYPGLQRRSALRERRPLALRRHTARVATRFAVLVAGDVVAILLSRAVALWLNAETLFGAQAFDSRATDVQHALTFARMRYLLGGEFTTGATMVREFNRDFQGKAWNFNLVVGFRVNPLRGEKSK